MKILLVGDFSETRDEGYKNVTHALAAGLQHRGHRLICLDVKRLAEVRSWRQAGAVEPDLIHVIAQPTYYSLVFTGLLHRRWPNAKIALSALALERFVLWGERNLWPQACLRLAGSDLILVQDASVQRWLQRSGFSAAQLPNGVDLLRFSPVSQAEKGELRRQSGLDLKRPLVLHVGHLEPDRNLMALAPLLEAGIQVVIAGSLCLGRDDRLIRLLERTGFNLLKGFQPQIERLYRMADAYVFPVLPGNSLSIPLSVLEAMSCNLKVATTRFPGLLNLFPEGRGLIYLHDPHELPSHVCKLLRSHLPVDTRNMVSRLSWEAVVGELIQHYEALLRP